MDFDREVAAHVKWRTRLRMFIGGGGETLESAELCKDDACALGKWIRQERTNFKDNAHYMALEREHANFHRCAADVVELAKSGDAEAAEALLDEGSFAAASVRTIGAIMNMKRDVAQKR